MAHARELRKLAAGLPERRDLKSLCQNAEAVLEDRNAVIHTIPLEDSTAGAEGGLTGWHPRTGQQIRLTMSVVLGHVQDLHMAWRRFDEAIAAATSHTGTRPVIRRLAVFGGPRLGTGAQATGSAVGPPGTTGKRLRALAIVIAAPETSGRRGDD